MTNHYMAKIQPLLSLNRESVNLARHGEDVVVIEKPGFPMVAYVVSCPYSFLSSYLETEGQDTIRFVQLLHDDPSVAFEAVTTCLQPNPLGIYWPRFVGPALATLLWKPMSMATPAVMLPEGVLVLGTSEKFVDPPRQGMRATPISVISVVSIPENASLVELIAAHPGATDWSFWPCSNAPATEAALRKEAEQHQRQCSPTTRDAKELHVVGY